MLSKRILITMLVVLSVHAQAASTDSNLQLENTATLLKNAEEADRQLNKRYQELRARLDDDAKRHLKNAELAWIAFRDKSCQLEAEGVFQSRSWIGKEYLEVAQANCLQRMTRKRTGEIDHYHAILDGEHHVLLDEDAKYRAIFSTKLKKDKTPLNNLDEFKLGEDERIYFIVKLYELEPNTDIDYQCRIFDAAGSLRANVRHTFNVNNNWYVTFCSIIPNRYIDKEGDWRFQVFLDESLLVDEKRRVTYQ